MVPAAILLCTGLSVATMFLMMPRERGLFVNGYPGAGVLALTSPLVFLCACVLVFFRPRLGYPVGGIGALLALPWFVLTESSSWESSWHYLNGPDQFFEGHRPVAILKIRRAAELAEKHTNQPGRNWLRLCRSVISAASVCSTLAFDFAFSVSPWLRGETFPIVDNLGVLL
jgi:hypothetical protein